MVYHWLKQPKTLVLTPLLLALSFALACGAAAPATPAPAAPAAPAAAPAATVATAVPKAPAVAATATPTPATQPKPRVAVARLVLGLPPPPHETNRPWLTSGSGLVQHNPMFDKLIGADPVTGEYKPTSLATKWEMAPDAKSWTLWLREGIPFHFGWGNLTAKDVEHSVKMWTQEEALQTRTGLLRDEVDRFETVNDHQTVLRLKKPDVAMDLVLSDAQGLSMLSKAQWDKEGGAGVEKRPAGTGSWRYKERSPGAYVRYERVENHWRKTPEFAEMEIRWVPEASTRLAMLLANEAHIADVPRELEGQAVARGMKKLPGTMPGIQTTLYFGGLFFTSPDKFDPQVPWTKREVREALNRAINRKELNNTIFKGEGAPIYVWDFHPAFAPVNPRWEKEFDQRYGYDPAKAKQLLAQAGYSNGFKVKTGSYLLSGFPELPEVAEALTIYWKAIGVQVEIEGVDFAVIRDRYRDKNNHQYINAHRSSVQDVVSRLINTLSVTFFYNDQYVLDRYKRLLPSINPEERKQLILEIGDRMFDEYATIPLFFLPTKVMVNPQAVSGWVFPGGFYGTYTHTEYIQAAR